MSKNGRIITLSVLSILIVICIVLGISYAFMQANIDTNSVTEVTLSSCAKLTLSETETSISLTNSYPMSKNRALQTTPYTFTLTSSCDGGVGFNIYLATLNSNTLDSSNIHYIITNHGSKNILVEGILSDATNGLSDFTSEEQAQLNSGINGTFASIYKIYVNGIYTNETKEYDLYLYIDESVTDPNTMNQIFVAGVAAKSFDYTMVQVTNVTTSNITNDSITLTVEATAGENQIDRYYFSSDGINYIESTTNTYTFNNLEQGVEYNFKVYAIDVNGIGSNVYELSESTNKIPAFADTCRENNSNTLSCHIATLYTVDGENDLYYHDGIGSYTNASEEARDNSYRYSGVDPNNYVCFGSDDATCPMDNLYRIIGVFGDQVKLIKYDYALENILGTSGAYSGFEISRETYKGSQSVVNFYYWNDVGVKGTGLDEKNWSESQLNLINLNTDYVDYLNNQNVKWNDMIEITNWITGGVSYDNVYNSQVRQAYNYEVISNSSSTTYNAKIGLMYVSDYGYAASPEYWTTNLGSYFNSTSYNWMYMGMYDFTITYILDDNTYVFCINNTGYVDGMIYIAFTDYYIGNVRPTFYLKSNVTLASGDGSISSPYRLQLS